MGQPLKPRSKKHGLLVTKAGVGGDDVRDLAGNGFVHWLRSLPTVQLKKACAKSGIFPDGSPDELITGLVEKLKLAANPGPDSL